MQDFRSMGIVSRVESLELVLVTLGTTQMAIRAANIKRLQRMNLFELEAPGQQAHPALRGYIYSNNLPIFDLAQLLGMDSTVQDYKKEDQILIVQYGERIAGFVVDQAQEVIRVGLNEVDLLPAVVEESLLRPAAWALWRKSQDEIIIIVEPTECFSANEWLQVTNKG